MQGTIKLAVEDHEIARCFPVMAALRAHLEAGDFVPLVRRMQDEGYRLAYLEELGEVRAVAGFRIYTSLFLGRSLYVDDLVTAPESRSRGHGRHLLGWLRERAVEECCRALHLDSDVQRHAAHRFYFEQGLHINCYHFHQGLQI